MMNTEKKAAKKQLLVFCILTFVITWAVFLLVPALGFSYGQKESVVIIAAAMFVPAICSILTRLFLKEGFRGMLLYPRFKGQGRAYLLVFFMPTVLILAGAALFFVLFPQNFDPQMQALQQNLAAAGQTGLTAQNVLLISILQIALIGPVVNILPTLGEELGWRGYLLPRLRLFFSDRAALVLTGIIWGAWHIPVIVMGHNYGTNYPGYPVLGILAMILFCVALGIVEGAVSIKMKSVIPAAMIHSAINAGAALPVYLTAGSVNPLLGPSITGIVGCIPFFVVAAVLMILGSRFWGQKKENAVVQKA